MTQKSTPRYTVYDTYRLLRVSAQRCHNKGAIITNVYKPTCQCIFPTPPYNNDQDLKKLKYIKLIALVNNSHMTLNIKICNINRNICKFLSVFIYVDVEYNCRSRFYMICKDHVQICRAKCGVVYVVYDRVQLSENTVLLCLLGPASP